MSEYYKQELVELVRNWPEDRLNMYIQELETRVKVTKELIQALRAIRKRTNRNKNLKDTGSRGGG